MDDREALRITIAEAKRKAGKKSARPDVTAAVKEGVLQALNEWEPEAEPAQFDALDPSVSAAEMERQYPGNPGVFRDRHGMPRPTSLAMSETEKLRLQRASEARAVELAEGAINLMDPSADKGKALRRYQQLGIDDPEVLAGVSDPVKKAPLAQENDASRNTARWEKARRGYEAHKRIAKLPAGWPIDTKALTADEYALYLNERGIDLSGVK